MGLGSLKDFNLAEARERARQARQLLADGKDPLSIKRAAKLEAMRMLTFSECAEAFMSVKLSGFSNEKHRSQWRSTLDLANKAFGSVPVSVIDTAMVLRLLRPLWDEVPSTAARLRGRIERILGWATAAGYRVGDNPARWRGHLQDMFPSKAAPKHLAAMDYREVPAFMERLRERVDAPARALEFTVLCAARTSEVLAARWNEIDLVERTWSVPAHVRYAYASARSSSCAAT